MRERDTSADAAAAQVAAHRRLGPEGRLALGLRLSEDVRTLALEGIRRRQPGLSEREALRELVRVLYGDALAARAYPAGAHE